MRFIVLLFFMLTGCSPSKENRQQVTIGLGEDISVINPLLSGTAYAKQVEELIYLPLYQFDPLDLRLKPVLAERAPSVETMSNGHVKYGFRLRDHAKWSDGKSISASDYAFTFKMIFNPALKTHGYRAYLSFLERIEIDPEDDQMIWVIANKPYHLAEIVLGNIELFPKHVHDPSGLLDGHTIASLRAISSSDSGLMELAKKFENYGKVGAKTIVGSGPYAFDQWEAGAYVLLKKKQNYWGQSVVNPPFQLQATTPFLKFKIIRDRQVAFQELKGEGMDIMNQVPLLKMKEVMIDEVAGLKGYVPSQFTHYYIALNPVRPGLENPDLRKALNQCFDVQEWIESQMYNMAVPITNPISPLKKYYDTTLPVINYAPKEAMAVFEKNGFNQLDQNGIRFRKKGNNLERLSFTLTYSASNESAASLAIFFKEKAKIAGVEIIPNPRDFPALRRDYRQGTYDLIFLAASVPPADYDPQQKWHTKSWGKGNRVRFGNNQTDQIIDHICESLEENERAEYYKAFQQAIYKNQPFIFLYSPTQRVVAKEGLKVLPSKLWPGFVTQTLQ